MQKDSADASKLLGSMLTYTAVCHVDLATGCTGQHTLRNPAGSTNVHACDGVNCWFAAAIAALQITYFSPEPSVS